MCNFSSVYASGRMKGSRAISSFKRDKHINLSGLYGKLKVARNDRIRDRLLKEFGAGVTVMIDLWLESFGPGVKIYFVLF